MNKRPTLSVGDIPIAPRRARPPSDMGAEIATKEKSLAAASPAAADSPIADTETKGSRGDLPNPSGGERKAAASQRSLDQEKARTRLRDLKRAQARESKHFVNVPLDYDTKMRLQKASFDNDLKMTVIMKAAIDQYLRENGY